MTPMAIHNDALTSFPIQDVTAETLNTLYGELSSLRKEWQVGIGELSAHEVEENKKRDMERVTLEKRIPVQVGDSVLVKDYDRKGHGAPKYGPDPWQVLAIYGNMLTLRNRVTQVHRAVPIRHAKVILLPTTMSPTVVVKVDPTRKDQRRSNPPSSVKSVSEPPRTLLARPGSTKTRLRSLPDSTVVQRAGDQARQSAANEQAHSSPPDLLDRTQRWVESVNIDHPDSEDGLSVRTDSLVGRRTSLPREDIEDASTSDEEEADQAPQVMRRSERTRQAPRRLIAEDD